MNISTPGIYTGGNTRIDSRAEAGNKAREIKERGGWTGGGRASRGRGGEIQTVLERQYRIREETSRRRLSEYLLNVKMTIEPRGAAQSGACLRLWRWADGRAVVVGRQWGVVVLSRAQRACVKG